MAKTKILGAVHGEFSSHTVRVLEIAKALRQRGGFEILFSGRGNQMNKVEEAGFDYVETPTISFDEIENALETSLAPVFYHKGNIESLFQAEDRLLSDYKPDIIIRDLFRELAGIAAKKHKVFDVFLQQASLCPYYHLDIKPANTPWYLRFTPGETSKIPPLFRLIEKIAMKKRSKYLRAKTKELGLELKKGFYGAVEADLILMPDSEVLFPFPEIKSNYKFLGPLLVLDKRQRPDWLDDFASDKRKKIVATCGSTGYCDRIDLIAEAFGDREYALAVNQTFGNSGEFYSGSFEPAFGVPYADVFITHGGIGSTYFGLRSGVPMIALYNHIEQQINAHQLSKLGVGIGLDSRKTSAQKLRKKTEMILDNPDFEMRAIEVSRKLAEDGAVKLAVEYIIKAYEEFTSKS